MSASVRHKQDNTALLVLAALSLALLTILSVWKLKQFKYRLINETGAAMFYGLLLGLTARLLWFDQEAHMRSTETVCTCHGLNSTPHILMVNTTSHGHCYRCVGKTNQRCSLISAPHAETFDPEVLFNLFLPPIIFHGAYTLNQRRFIENLGSVLTFAFLGTIISCMCIGACMYGFTRLMVLLGQAAHGEFFLIDCLLFGAIVSATDPDFAPSLLICEIHPYSGVPTWDFSICRLLKGVNSKRILRFLTKMVTSFASAKPQPWVSVLGLLSELRVDLDLHTLLFGESVLNDAVAIVLTHAITTYNQTGAGHIFDPAAFFLSVGLFLGVLVGSFFIGFIFTVITALLTKFTRLHENPLLETSVFFLLSWSSFLSAEAAGLSGIVAVLFCGLSQARYTVLNLSSEGITRTKQLFEVFNFLGEIFIFGYMGYVLLTFPHHVFKALFISGAFLSIFISRACNIYPLSFLLNLGRANKIPRTFQHFMMLTGLRGAVAFSLAARDTSTEVRRTILTTTLLLVGFTIWVLGSASDPVLRRLDIRVGVDADENPQDLSFEVPTGRPDTTRGLWHRLDYKYLKPLLTHCGPPLTDSLPQCCGAFARVFSSPHVQELCIQEQLVEIEPEDSNLDLEKAENQLASTGGDSGSEHQEDLVEGDLGLGTVQAHITES